MIRFPILTIVALVAAQAAADERPPHKWKKPPPPPKEKIEAESRGALPKGDVQKLDIERVRGPSKPTGRRSCFIDLGRPPGGNGVFTPDGKSFFLLASTRSREDGKLKLTLYKVRMVTFQAEAMLSIDHMLAASLMTHGDPIVAISAVSFTGTGNGCFEGPAKVVSISLAKDNKAGAVANRGEWQFVATPRGRQLVNMPKSHIVEIDTETFQYKRGVKIDEAERALFYDAAGKLLVTLHDDGKTRGLVSIEANDEKTAKRLALDPGDRVLQDGDDFAAAAVDTKANTLEIKEVVGWSSKEQPANFKITVPELYPVSAASIEVNLAARIAAVFGGSFIARTDWKRIWIYEYKKPDPVVTGALTGKQYYNYVGIDPTGRFVMVEIRDLASRETVALKLWDVARRAWQNVILPPVGG